MGRSGWGRRRGGSARCRRSAGSQCGMTDYLARMNLTRKHERRRVGTVQSRTSSESALVICRMVENEVADVCVTDRTGEVWWEAFRDRGNSVPSVSLSHHGCSISQPCNDTGFREDGVGRRPPSGVSNNGEYVRES